MINNEFQFSQAEANLRAEIYGLIKKVLAKNYKDDLVEITYPPENVAGDYSVPCFALAQVLKTSPADIAKELASKIKPTKLIKEVKPVGPYLNFFVNMDVFSKLVLTEISKSKDKKDKYGQVKLGGNKKVMVEYFSPNTNKPLTIGHIRNICLGDSIAKLFDFSGYKIIRSTLYNDRGAAIAKVILGYQKWGKSQSPQKANMKPDHFVGSFYTKFFQEEKKDEALAEEAKKTLQDWESGNKEVKAVWKKLMGWVLEGFSQTLEKLGIKKFDEQYYESDYYSKGKKVVEQGLKKKVFSKDSDGLVLAKLEKYNIPDKIVLRPDETSLYITQDLYLATLKDKNKLDSSIYVVGSEQDLYFKQLFKILELLGFKNAKNYRHISYGMIRLASGKIKSREGLVKGTGADDLIAQLEVLAKTEIKKRSKDLSATEVDNRAKQISIAALKFYILAVNPKTTMVFDPEKSIAFTGRTGPYLQYVHARINSIFTKAKVKPSTSIDFGVFIEPSELELIKLLAKYPSVIAESVKNYDPSVLANYLYELAKTFSLFYEKANILKAEEKVKKARLLLIDNVKTVLASGLNLLGIEAPEKM